MSEIFPISCPDQTREENQKAYIMLPLCMSRHVHTSVWLSNLPSPARSVHTDSNTAGPDGPGRQRMKGGSGRKKRVREKESTTE